MKRSHPATRLPSTPVHSGTPNYSAAARVMPVEQPFVQYKPVDVRLRARALASDRECTGGAARLVMQAPTVYVHDEEGPHFFNLPNDVLVQIIPRLDRKAMGPMAASCRLAYLYVDRLDPMRRLPGLLGDLQKLRVGNLPIHPNTFKAFLQAIAVAGDYERALLTPPAQALRCAMAVAMQAWAVPKLFARDRLALNTVTVNFIEKNFEVEFENGIGKILEWHFDVDKKPGSFVANQWEYFFRNSKLDIEQRSRIFETLFNFLCLPKPDLNFRFQKLYVPENVTVQPLCVGLDRIASEGAL